MQSVTSELVRLHSDYYGKGPTKARSYIVSDTVVAILEGGFTTVEATLIAEGKSRAVHEVRRSFQSAMEGRFREVVEKATGRKVVAYLSQIHTDPDLAVELFVLDGASATHEGEQNGGGPAPHQNFGGAWGLPQPLPFRPPAIK